MNIIDIIEKKKHNKELSSKEIEYIVDGFVSNEIKDYQMSALAMAIWFNGMTIRESANLTIAMENSGDVIDLSGIEGIKVDKHSTGGVGDKVTLIVAPIVAALGAPIAKMSGKGLGYTGGTLDKLESIPGYKIEVEINDFKKQVSEIGVAVIGQTSNLVPADRILYALRDVTGTVDSVPLISASILSKKFATGSDAILLDVKCGDGAFMKTFEEAKVLGETMIEIGKLLNKNLTIEITDMSKPLGTMIGNKNEVIEAIEFLKGNSTSHDLKEISYSAIQTLLIQAGIVSNEDEAKKSIDKVIANGDAIKKFKEWIAYQGGDVEHLFSDDFWSPKHVLEIKAEVDGFLKITSAVNFGKSSLELGGGRKIKTDTIDYDAGIELLKVSGDAVTKGEVLFRLYSSSEINKEALEYIENGYNIINEKIVVKNILGKFK